MGLNALHILWETWAYRRQGQNVKVWIWNLPQVHVFELLAPAGGAGGWGEGHIRGDFVNPRF